MRPSGYFAKLQQGQATKEKQGSTHDNNQSKNNSGTWPNTHKKLALHFTLKQKKNNNVFAPRRKENITQLSNRRKPAGIDNNPPDRENQANKENTQTTTPGREGKATSPQTETLERTPIQTTIRPPPTRRQERTHEGTTRTIQRQQRLWTISCFWYFFDTLV